MIFNGKEQIASSFSVSENSGYNPYGCIQTVCKLIALCKIYAYFHSLYFHYV